MKFKFKFFNGTIITTIDKEPNLIRKNRETPKSLRNNEIKIL